MSENNEGRRVWDTGLQPERTNLAWSRSAVAFLVLGLAAPRALWIVLGPWSLLPAAILLAGSAALLAMSRRRYALAHHALIHSSSPQLPDGRLPALATGLALLCGLLALTMLAIVAVRPN